MFQRQLFSTRKAVQAGRRFLLRTVRTAFTQIGTGPNLRMLAFAGICGLVFSAVFAYGIPQAFATQAPAHTVTSYYVTSTNTTTAYNHGCAQGSSDTRNHYSNSMVILDFGGQVSTSTVDNWDAGYISNGTVESLAEHFAYGYWNCSGPAPKLKLAIGTNNSITSSSSLGAAWAHVAAAVQSYDQSHGYTSQVTAMGGNDIESWGGESAAEAWASGYSGAGSATLYADFGSADGCPTTSSNNAPCYGTTTWNQYGYWYVSWGAAAAVPLPEIYNSSWATQWKEISLYGYYHQNLDPIFFWGPVCTPGFISCTAAWDDLWNALNSSSHTAQSLTYLLNIGWFW